MNGNFRDLIKKTSPWWFRRGVAERVLYCFGLVLDGLVALAIAALRLRYPGDNALFLAYHASERRLRQGKYETSTDYAARLARYFQAHLDRGGPYAMLEQIYQHYRPNNFDVYLYYESGAYFHLATDGTVTQTIVDATGADAWAHWTLIFVWPVGLEGDGLWSDHGTWNDPNTVWDYATLTPAEVADLRLIPQEWNAAHCNGTIVLLGPDDALWNYPAETWDAVGIWDDGSPPAKLEIN